MFTILPAALAEHHRHDVLGRQEGAPEVDREDVVPVLRPDLVDRRLDGPGRPRAVHQDVDAVEGPRPRLATMARTCGLVADVGGDDEGPPAEGPSLPGHRLERRRPRARPGRDPPPRPRGGARSPAPCPSPLPSRSPSDPRVSSEPHRRRAPARRSRSPRAGRGPGARATARPDRRSRRRRTSRSRRRRRAGGGTRLLPLDVARASPSRLERDAVGRRRRRRRTRPTAGRRAARAWS